MVNNIVHVVSFNVRGIRDYNKRSEIISRIVYPTFRPHPDIVFLQETHSTHNVIKNWKANFQMELVCSHGTSTSGGLLIGFKRALDYKILNVVRSPTFLLVNCIINNEEYTLVNVYQTHNLRNVVVGQLGSPRQSREDIFFDNLQLLWKTVLENPSFKVLIGGDFNAVEDLDVDVADKRSSEWRLKQAEVFSKFMEETNMSDVWKVFHPGVKRFTRSIGQHTPARLDRFLVSDLLFNYSQDADIGLRFQSDHNPIYFSFYSNRNSPGHDIFRFPTFLTTDETYKSFLAEEIKHFVRINVEEVNEVEQPSPSLLWDTMKAVIRSETIRYLKIMKKDREKVRVEIIETRDRAVLIERERDREFQNTERAKDLSQQLKEANSQLFELCTLFDKSRLTRNIRRKAIFNNSCSAYFFRKIGTMAGALRYLHDTNGVVLHSDQEILDHCTIFYDNLYGRCTVPSGITSNFSDSPSSLHLTDDNVQLLSEPLTLEDLHNAVKDMKKMSAPGLDGLTVPFYQEFWPLIGKYVFDSISEAHEHEHFTIDQRRGLLKLIPKRNKNPGYVHNLRPITLLNVDYKMVTKALAKRMSKIIPNLIHTDQKGFVHGRFLGEGVIELQTLITMIENYEQAIGDEFSLLSLDIEKAFDSIDWGFMRQCLISYGFPSYFMQWIHTIQSSVELRIANNGHLSAPFKVLKGVAQGDALSPFLFILVIESLACAVRQDSKVIGFQAFGQNKKVAMVADDSLFYLKCEQDSLIRFRNILEHFQFVSGLKINYDKSRLVPLNANPSWCKWDCVKDFLIVKYGEPFSYLGAQLGADQQIVQKTINETNFPFSKQMITSTLRSRPIMTTCITGRILQVKSLIASKFVYLFQLLPTPSLQWREKMEKLYFDHIWENGRHRIAKSKMIAPKIVGGFNMLDIYCQEKALKLKWIDRLMSETVNIFYVVSLCNSSLPHQYSRCPKMQCIRQKL